MLDTRYYSPITIGDLREQVEKARRITEEQKVILDKIKHVHVFFQGLESVCGAVEDVSEATLLWIRSVPDDARRSIRISRLLRPPYFHYTR